MELITLDFETYYDKKYSLSKLTTEEYIRSDKFEVIGVAVKVGDGESRWCSGTYTEIKEFLDSYHMHEHNVVAHNCMFDGAILSWIYDIHPRYLTDTMFMSRAVRGVNNTRHNLKVISEDLDVGRKGTEVLDAIGKHRLDFSTEELDRYGEYCKNDVELTWKVENILGRHIKNYNEFNLMDITLKMFTEPRLLIDKSLLEASKNTISARKAELIADANTTKEVLMSNPQFAEALEELNVTPPTKISPSTGEDTYALAKTDQGFKDLLEHTDVRVRKLAMARLEIKSTQEESRIDRFIDIANRGLLPIPLLYCGAHTTRWSGADSVNIQNLPSRGEKTTLKKSITAPDGYMLVEVDSSQIEARALAWFAGQDDLTEAFRNKEDVYKIMASKIYSKPIKDISKEERFVGKTVILGCGYGMGHKRFRDYIKLQGVDISESESIEIINIYRESNPRIRSLWGDAQEAVRKLATSKKQYNIGRSGVVTTINAPGRAGFILPSGSAITYPNIRTVSGSKAGYSFNPTANERGIEFEYDSKPNVAIKIYGAKAVENIVQGLARCIIGEQMLGIAKKYKVLLTVHDSVLALVPEHEVDQGRLYIETCMREVPHWAKGLPLDCESGVGKNYGDCK